jgi:hypothetical protein
MLKKGSQLGTFNVDLNEIGVPGRIQPFNRRMPIALFFVQLYRWCPSILKAITIIRPEMIGR